MILQVKCSSIKLDDEDETHKVIIYFLNPCEEINNVNDQNLFFAQYMKELCDEKFENVLQRALDETSKCVLKSRKKRSLLKIASIVGVVVNNLLKAQYKSGTIDRQIAVRSFNDHYDSGEIFDRTSKNYLSMCSETAKEHYEIVKERQRIYQKRFGHLCKYMQKS